MDSTQISALPARRPSQGMEEEASWIEVAKSASAAFEPLSLRYRVGMDQYVRTRAQSNADAADLTQHVFLQALAALPRYHQRGVPVAVWLFLIARHLALNQCQRSRRCVSWDALPEALHGSLRPLETKLASAQIFSRVALKVEWLDRSAWDGIVPSLASPSRSSLVEVFAPVLLMTNSPLSCQCLSWTNYGPNNQAASALSFCVVSVCLGSGMRKR